MVNFQRVNRPSVWKWSIVIGLTVWINTWNVDGKFRASASRKSDYDFVSVEEDLYGTLFDISKYNKAIRPVERPSETVNVNITFSLMQIHSLDERTQVFRTYGWLVVQWMDRRLIWKPHLFDNMTTFTVDSKLLWLPELALINAVEWQFPNFDNYRAIVDNNGHVRWEPAGVFETSCKIDITIYPYDRQECELVFGTWTYTSKKVNMTKSTDTVILDDYSQSGEWEITKTTLERKEFSYQCCQDLSFSKVSAKIYLDRKHRFFTMNLVLPCAMLSSLTLVTFLSPPDQGEKMSLGISILLSFSVFMLTLSENMPKTSESLPLFGIFTTYVMLMNTTSVMLTVFVLNLHHRHDSKPVPNWVRRLIFNGLARVLCMYNHEINLKADNHYNPGRLNLSHYRTSSKKRSRDGFNISSAAKQLSGQIRSNMGTSPNPYLANRHNSVSVDNTNHFYEKVAKMDRQMSCEDHRTTNHSNLGGKMPGLETQLRDLDVQQQHHADEWRELARVMDRLFFWFTLLAMASFCASVLVIAWTKD